MTEYVILGATYAFAAAAQPGQFQAYLISESIAHGWRRTLPAALAPVMSDLPIIGLALIVLTQVPPAFVHGLRLVGGVYVLYLAWAALRAWRSYRDADTAAPDELRLTVIKAALVNLLNPNPYIGWTLVMGPVLLQAWRISAADAVAMVVAFYAVMTLSNALIIGTFASARSLGAGVARALLGASAIALACLGVYQIWVGVFALALPRP